MTYLMDQYLEAINLFKIHIETISGNQLLEIFPNYKIQSIRNKKFRFNFTLDEILLFEPYLQDFNFDIFKIIKQIQIGLSSFVFMKPHLTSVKKEYLAKLTGLRLVQVNKRLANHSWSVDEIALIIDELFNIPNFINKKSSDSGIE